MQPNSFRRILDQIAWFLLLYISAGSMYAGHGRIAGVSLVSPPREVQDGWTESVCQLNAGWVAIQPYAFSFPGDPIVHFNMPRQWWGERIEGARELVRQAHRSGIKVMLKPMVYVPGGWVGSYTLESEENWLKWEQEYRRYILENAEMAKQESVEMICIGTEFNEAVSQRPAFWRSLAQEVRTIFPGKLTYAANWDHYQEVKFWDLLDFVGVDAYFPLSEAKVPNVAELKRLWREPAKMIEFTHRVYGKPVLFTEFGYRSVHGCTWKQWEIERVPHHQQVNLQAQVNAYLAFFEYFWDLDWFAGLFLWQWYTTDATAGGHSNSDYTPQNKPAEELICKWFGS